MFSPDYTLPSSYFPPYCSELFVSSALTLILALEGVAHDLVIFTHKWKFIC